MIIACDSTYVVMQDHTHADAVCAMMQKLYAEDPAASGEYPRAFSITIDVLLANPARGQIILINENDQPVGYAILTPHWSNEYVGTIVFVDELYVTAPSRGRGLARGLFAKIEQERPYDAVAVFLEVSSGNDNASKLYSSLGLERRTNTTMAKHLK